jgi:CCR4-NOT transcription complex subunit 1
MFGKWQNVKGQISLIRECLMAPKILIDFQLSEKFMPPISGIPLPNLAVYHNESPAATIGLQNQAWYSIDLVETLLELAEGNMYFEIQALIQPAVDFLPEHLVCILAQVKNTGVLGDHLLSYLMPLFLRIHPHSGIVIPVLWKANSSLCVEWMGMLYAKESSFLPRILDIAQDLKLMEPLQSILNAPPFSFAIDLATLASRREFLNLEKWLKTRIEEHGAFFVNDCVDFMKDYLEYATNGTAPNRHCVTLMSPDIIETFSRCILNFSGFTPSQKEQVNQLFRGCMQVPGTRHESIEKEANSYFQKIYDSSLSIEEMIVQLKAFRESSDPRQREVYEVMIHSLFDEYRFFRKYPLKELQITGELFGSLIANDLLIEDNLELALRNVIECMSNPADSKLYQFGIWALEQFSFRVRQWPQFLQQLLSIPHFAVTNPELASACRGIPTHLVGASLPAEVPAREPTRVEVSKAPEPVAPVDTRPSFASALALQFPGSAELAKIDTDDLLHCRGLHVWTSLSTIVRDRLSLLLNSVALNNVSDKSQELIAILRTPDIVQQFVHYVVSKRVSNEPNNHEVYLILLRKTEVDGVMREAVLSTYYCINFLLSSALVISPGNERNFLKHLGIWLGELTVAVNRPPFAKYLDLKKLVLVAYRTSHFQVVLFLVCKVLLGCSKSKIFKPPNPWLMSLASLLAEAHQLTELKANTRFEIELLFNRLQVEVDDIQIRGVFAQSPTRSLPLREEAPDIGLHGSGAVAPGEASESGIFVSPSLGQLAANPHVRDIIFMSLDATIREVVHSVVDSPVSIACITTKELILKDFAVEPDENKMRLAAHYMVQNLAGNLAVFSGKDLLLDVFMKRLKEFLTQHLRLSTSESLEDAVRVIARDNFDLACSFIDRTAKERAIEKIDETLAHQYYIRKRHAETGSPFQDPAALTASGGFPASLPDVLRPKLRLTPQQLKVYQDFALPPRTQEAQVPLSIEPSIAPGPDYAARDPAVQELHAAQKHMELVLQVIDEIIVQLSKEDPVTILRDSKLNQAISSVSSILSRLGSAQRQQMAIAFSQRVMSMLIEPSVPLHMEVCLMLLKAVRVAYPEIPRELTMMLLRALDVQVLNLDAVAGLIREGLIIVPQLDATFARLLPVAGHPSVFQSIIGFLNRSIVIERAVLPADFQLTLECLTRLSSRLGPELGEQIGLLLDRCRTVMSRTEPSSEMIGSAVSGDRHFSQQCFTLFDEWVNIYVRHPKIPEKLVFQFLTAFEQEGMMKSSLSIDAFFGVLTPACLAAAASKDAPFEFIDSLSKLVVVLVDVMRPSISTGKLSGSVILSSFLNILTDLIIRNSETQGEGFDQKPYFRLYSSLIQDLCVSDDPSHPVEIDDLLTFSSALNRVSPIHVPSFCFSWLQLIAHRFFMPSILLTKNPRCFVHFQNLLIDLFKFLERFLRKAELTDSILLLYRGTIRVLLILLHDFPEFLCEFHFSFCDVIPPTCIQLRNMVLSAFPRNMRLPDPFLPNLKVDLLAEIKVEPKIRSETTTILAYKGINKDIDLYLKKRGVPTIFDDLVDKMFLSAEDAAVSGTVYNTPLMNALVLYIGMQEIRNSKQDQSTELVSKEAMELFLNIVLRLDEEGRYHFFNGITNQLRFPNSHTYYFSCILLFLFSESPSETIREQITK